ncbi:PH domain-containing protein [Halomarina ordinaria]|uniref:PH domain-containing protein n=1 Tax=Halomarina ordinaria TaxID=3033939 RepID=A0ABD5U456_9EURY|nr:PH domain-containing protein [Halomarina sp. PSRA2]
MSARTASESPTATPDWLALDERETVLWRGGPRIQTVLPGVAVGVVLLALGVAALLGVGPVPSHPAVTLLALCVLVGGLSIPLAAYLVVRNTDYVVTDRGLYRKRGVLSRSVLSVGYETVQNATYAQGVTGTLFGYGTLTFDTAGSTGEELSFRDVDDPSTVQSLVSRRIGRVGEGDVPDGGLPGTTAEWRAVREEVRALRRALEARRGE